MGAKVGPSEPSACASDGRASERRVRTQHWPRAVRLVRGMKAEVGRGHLAENVDLSGALADANQRDLGAQTAVCEQLGVPHPGDDAAAMHMDEIMQLRDLLATVPHK